jgi:hypothetical protein
MMGALRDYWNIWRVTTAQREGGVGRIMRGVMLSLLIVVTVIVGIVTWRHGLDGWTMARVVLGLGALWFAPVWMVLFLPGSVLLNTAVNAKLLPRQRRRLVQMFVGGWLLITAALTAVAGKWAAFPVVNAYILAVGLMMMGNMQALGLVILAGNWPWLSRLVLPPALAETLNGDTAAAALMVLLVPAGMWGVRWIYPAGGDPHFERRSKQARRMARLQGSAGAENDLSWGGALTYAAALRRDCKAADPGRMLLHALGPAAHWSAWIGSGALLLVLAVFVGVMLMLGGAVANSASLHGISIAWLGTQALVIVFSTVQFSQQMTRTAGEQALLRLSPLAGDAALLNRRLATQLLQGALRLWIGMTAVILAVSALVSGDAAAAVRELALCCLAGQVAMMGLLGNYAGTGGWRLGLGLRAALLAVVQAIAAVGLGRLSGTPAWLCLIAITLATCAIQLSWAWARMLAAPPSFPARRLVD